MIVICTKCQAKFLVADEKIGRRGAKVRCSRCQTIFLVRHDTGIVRVVDAPAKPPPAAAPAPGAMVDLEPPWVQQPPDDPFAPARHDPYGGKDPFSSPEESRPTLPVTDLSDLLGPATPAAVPRPSVVPPPLPSWIANGARAAPADRAPPALDAAPPSDAAFGRVEPAPLEPAAPFGAPSMDADPFAPPSHAAPFPPMPSSELSDGLGLALEDRLTPPPMKVVRIPDAEPALDFGGSAFGEAPAFEAALGASRDPFASAGVPYDPGFFEYASGPIEDAPVLGNHAPAAAPASQDPAPSRASPAFAEGLKPSAAAAAARVASRATDERIPHRRSSRLRAVAVNAVALAVLLLVALAILALWRTEGPIEAGSLRPSALLAALRGGGAAPDPFGAHDVSSGVYERQRGAPLLFVSGKVVSRAAAPVAAVKVSVEVVRDGQVLARGEAIAGAVPTPEELYAAADDAALARAAKAARRRAPAAVKPGDAVPFLVAIGDAPPDLEGAAIRLDVAAAGGSP